MWRTPERRDVHGIEGGVRRNNSGAYEVADGEVVWCGAVRHTDASGKYERYRLNIYIHCMYMDTYLGPYTVSTVITTRQ